MLIYILKRFLETIPVLILIITLAFALLRFAPGNPFETDKGMPEEVRKALDAQYGFDRPFYEQYWAYLRGIFFDFDFGPSMKYQGWTVSEIIGSKFLVSLELGAYALAIALSIGIATGIFAAWKQNSISDEHFCIPSIY